MPLSGFCKIQARCGGTCPLTLALCEKADPKDTIEQNYMIADEKEKFSDPPLGLIEPHAGRLRYPLEGQLLYKIIKAENFVRSLKSGYLYFNRVDSYNDFPGADKEDGKQLSKDQPINEKAVFAKSHDFTLSDYYNKSRARTYACCFSLTNSNYTWENYATGGKKGKICLVFDFQKLRESLNNTLAQGNSCVLYECAKCHQIFDINYGLIEYVDRRSHQLTQEHYPNPIQYTFIKDSSYSNETELRIALSAIGLGEFALSDGKHIEFPEALQLSFDFRHAIGASIITQVMHSSDCDTHFVGSELNNAGIEIFA